MRERKSEKQADTATALGLSRSTYANYEAGHNLPKADVLLKIISHFGVPFEIIMTEDLRKKCKKYFDKSIT
ncbi:helix-turn-helix transcriptional regulator [Niabella defluvii]|nr:helix-turn-helix transcriptional regulator [Niabella sp. I65]